MTDQLRADPPRLFEYLADAFTSEGVGTVFGLMGDGNMRWLAEMAARPSVRVVHARHEAAALAMADGWAQATGDVGVCSVTCGPGVTNLVTSLRVAAHNRTPMVILAGDTPVSAATHYQQFDIGELRSSAGVAVMKIRDIAEAAAKTRIAFATARRERKPVVLAVPYDLAEKACELAPYAGWQSRPSPEAASDADIEAVRERLDRAGDVLLLVGRGTVASGSLDAVRDLASRLSAHTGTTVKALGALHGEERNLGVIGGFSSEGVRAQVRAADVVLALGASLSWFTTLDGALIDPDKTVQVVDRADAWDPGYLFEPSRRIVADCQVFLTQLLAALPEREGTELPPRRQPESAPLPSSGVQLQPGEGFDPVEALATFRRAVDAPVRLLVGAGHFWNHVVEMPEPPDPTGLQMHNGFGAIAHAFPAAIGAAVATPTLPTIVIEGDGSLMMNLQELETASRSEIPLLVLVMNDGAYGAELHKLVATGMRAEEAIFGYVDFAGVASALGARSYTPPTLTELTSHVKEFLREPSLTIIDLRLSRRVLAGRYREAYTKGAPSTGRNL